MKAEKSSEIRKAFAAVLLVIFFQISFLQVSGQETDTIVPIKKSTTELFKNLKINTFNGKGFNFFEDKFSGHWSGFDFGLNSFLNTDYSGYETEFMDISVYQSYAFQLNIFQYSVGLQSTRNNIGVVTGLGFQMQDYRLADSITLTKNFNGVAQPKEFHLGDYQKSLLSVYSVIVPVLVEFQVPVNDYRNRFYISAGMFFGYRIGSYTKIKYRTDHTEKLKITGNYALSDFRHGVAFRAGYRWVNVFAMYELSGLFEDKLGPEIHPLTFGITLVRF